MMTGGPAPYFLLVLILSLPFYGLGLTGAALPFAPALPISALMACVPMAAALFLTARRGWARLFSMRPLPKLGWAIVALAIMPAAFAATAGVLWLTGPDLPVLTLLPLRGVLSALALFGLGAVGEEVGWQGYAVPALASRQSALRAALIIGAFWALWHVVPFALMGRSAAWILWQSGGMILMRIVIVWLVMRAGNSLLIAVLFHTMSNSVWGLFADYEPFYDPKTLCAVLILPVLAIVIFWRPAALIRFSCDAYASASGDR